MVKPVIYGGDWIDPKGIMDFPTDVDIFAAVEERGRTGRVKKVMAVFFEPEGTRISNDYVIRTQRRYDLILTLDPQILAACPKARFFPFGTSWIRPEDADKVADKKFGVTMICGGKDWMPGHKFRRQLWERQDEITIPHVFWRSAVSKPPGHEGNPNLCSDLPAKYVAFDHMYHVCIENCRVENYFSEKLCDCLVTKTVPLYWGCRNVHAFFNPNAMIGLPDDCTEIIKLVNNLRPDYYYERKQAIEMNAALVTAYTRDVALRVGDAIREALYAQQR